MTEAMKIDHEGSMRNTFDVGGESTEAMKCSLSFCSTQTNNGGLMSSVLGGGGNNLNTSEPCYQTKLHALYKKNSHRASTTTTTPSGGQDAETPSSAAGVEGQSETTAEALLAKELNELSLQEREAIMDDIHGVSRFAEETPELVESKLIELDDAIDKMYKKKKISYDRALFLSPTRVRDKKFRIMFLRADLWDVQKAARRLVKHFEYKSVLFGADKIVKTITMNDLDEDDMESLLTGSFQFAKSKDRAGRTVLLVTQSAYKFKSWINQVRRTLRNRP